MGAFSWLRGGRDHQLAATRYAGRQSATDKARRKQTQRGTFGEPHRNATEADRAGMRWADRQR